MYGSLQGQKFPVILADPPWHWKAYSAKGEGRSAKNHYRVMTLDAIKALPVQDVAADDCVLFLWGINSMLPQALDVVAAWGFEYQTLGFVWAKTTKRGKWHIGCGYYTRQNPEVCLLATRGKGRKRLDKGVRTLIVAQVREHSQKPDEICSNIERLFAGPYLELFARTRRRGWQTWGDETGKFGPVSSPSCLINEVGAAPF